MSSVFLDEYSAEICRSLVINAGLSGTNASCCPFSSDGFRNWSVALVNTVAVQRCPANYNQDENITRACEANGQWQSKSNYDRCLFPKNVTYHILTTWFVGYAVSMIALWIALIVLRYFRSLRCLRNEIHCNLIASFIVRVFTWYMISLPQLLATNWPVIAVNVTTIIYLFSSMANFFWMFVEGLYLFTIIVWTYGVDRFKIWHYSIIGWGIPFVLSGAAAISISLKISSKENWFYHPTTKQIKMIVVYIPILISIIINVFVMLVIVYTLFNKLKQTKTPLVRRSSKLALFSTEYRKAIRAAAVLIPLLGIAQCLFMFQPKVSKFSGAYQMFNALLTSTQGFFVALIYCFNNREVRLVIRAKYRSLRGFLPNSSRTRQTLDDSIGPVRRGNSAFKPHKIVNDNNVFKCRSYKFHKPNNGNTAELTITNKEVIIENQEV